VILPKENSNTIELQEERKGLTKAEDWEYIQESGNSTRVKDKFPKIGNRKEKELFNCSCKNLLKNRKECIDEREGG